MVSNISTSTSTTSLAVDGLISGLDTTSLIEQLVSVQTQRISIFETEQAAETQKIALFQQLQGLYLGVQTSANALKSSDLFEGKFATSSNTDVLSVTATDKAALGSHTITVKQLAAKNQFASNRFADTNTTTLGTGTLTITVGSGASAVNTDITIDSSNNTLAGIEQAINNSAANVTAEILKVDDSSNPFQLIVTATEGGLSNAVSVSHDATLKTAVSGEILGVGAVTNTQDTDDSDAKTYSLRHIPNAGTVKIKVDGTEITADMGQMTVAGNNMSASSVNDGGGSLTVGREYSYVVSAVDASGETIQSEIVSHTVTGGNDAIDFQFDDVDGAASYRIYRVDDTEYASPGAGNVVASDFQNQDSLIGTVADDGSANFTFRDTGQAQQANQRALAASTQGYTLTTSTGAVVFNQNQTASVTADYDYDFEFVETQVAKDAEIVFGEGANALTIKKSTNSISDVIEGVTIDLKKIDETNPVIIDVKRDTVGLQGTVQSFLDSLNQVNSFISDQTFFDEDTFEKGPLLSDPNLFNIRTRVSGILTDSVASIEPGKLRALSELGIELSATTGNYSLNSTTFTAAVNDKLDEVRNLFASVGTASDVDVEVVGFSDKTKTSDALGYFVNITQAATRAEAIGAQNISGGITVDEELIITSGSVTATANLTNGMTAQTAVNTINSALKSASITDVVALYDSSTGKISLRHETFGSEHSFKVTSDQANATAGTSGLGAATAGNTVTLTGQDVAGTINGEAATGKGKILTGASGNTNTDGLQLSISVTPDNLTTQGAIQGRVVVSRGIAAELEEFLAFLTDETQQGPIQSAIDQADSRIADLQESINLYTERAQREREKLLLEFSALESALGSLQTTSTFLEGQLQQIAATSQAIIKK